MDYWSYKSCKAPVKSSPPTNQYPVFTGWMPFLSPNQQFQSTEREKYHIPWTCLPQATSSLTTNSSWLPWWRVAMPLISPLMPVPHLMIRYFSGVHILSLLHSVTDTQSGPLRVCRHLSSSFSSIQHTK